MPRSSDEGKMWMCDKITQCNPQTVLDVGPGWGTYARLLRIRLPRTQWVCVEVFEPYVDKYSLYDWYDQIIVNDIRRLVKWPKADVVIFGDVLEHMPLVDASLVWSTARLNAQHAIASIPIVHYPQGELEDNIHETHIDTWSHDIAMSRLTGITDHWQGPHEIGCYYAPGVR